MIENPTLTEKGSLRVRFRLMSQEKSKTDTELEDQLHMP